MASESSALPTASCGSGIVNALNREWRDLIGGHRGTAIRWAAQHPVLLGSESLDDIVAAVRIDSDAVLAALLTEVARSGSAVEPDGESNGEVRTESAENGCIAARVVLQSQLGRMVAMARRDPRAGVDDYVSALWCRIRTYPLQARPNRIAANLSLDALQTVKRDAQTARWGEVTPWPPDVLLTRMDLRWARDPRASETDDVRGSEILERGRRLELIDQATFELLRGVYLEGLSGEAAARRHHTSAGSVRVRCSRALSKLAAHSEQLIAAA